MNNKNFRRILTFVLAVILALGFLSTVAFTVGATNGTISFDDLLAAGCPSGTCGETVNWAYDGTKGLLIISGTGEMEVEQDTPWDAYKESITSVVIEEGVTKIGDFAFSWCENLVNVTIAKSVKNIGTWAFYQCGKLKNVEIPNGVTTIGDFAFYFCFALESVKIPDSVTDAGDFTFYGCSSMTSLDLGNGITEIGERMFYSCTKLESVVIGNKITAVGPLAFSNCTELADVTIGYGVKTIGDGAFEDCTALKNVYYSGTQEQWNAITIGENNACLTGATIHVHNHSYSAVVTKPTCTTGGYTTYTCGCGHTYVADKKNALNHSYTNGCDTTCNRTGCGATRKTTHKYSEVTCTTPKTCTVCGVTDGSALGHSYAAETCTRPMTCTVCGATEGKALGHSYAAATCTKAKTCTRCKATTGKALGHSYAAATCTKAKTCTRCKATSGKALGHSYAAATCTKAKTCTRCKATSGKALGHSYSTTVKKATLKKSGSVVTKCTTCGSVESSKTVKRVKTFKLSATSYSYDGKTKTPTVTVKDSSGNTLKKDTDYTVSYAKGRKNVGTYKVTITLKGNYSGSKTLSFKIKTTKISKCTVKLEDDTFTYNGKVKTPKVVVKNSIGTKLKKGTHYTVTYSKGRKNVGEYEVTIKMKGGYSGTKTLTFKIVPKAASINKLTAKSKAITVKLNRSLQQSTGYEIQYSTKKNFKSADEKLIKSYKTSSTTLSKLKAKTTYYVRVRTYKTVSGEKIYSNWSSYKSIKTK